MGSSVIGPIAADEHWLEALVRPLERDGRLAGTFARQLPRPEASALTRQALLGWVGAKEEARYVAFDSPQAFFALSPAEQLLHGIIHSLEKSLTPEALDQFIAEREADTEARDAERPRARGLDRAGRCQTQWS